MLYLLLFVIALIAVALISNRATRACRWREYPQGDGPRWRCAACGARTDTPDGKPPKACQRHHG
jgi:hypothetical protein